MSAARPLSFVPELQSLRAVAVALVVVHHYVERPHPVHSFLPLGWTGVQFFFVLSAFLITRILLSEQDGREQTGASVGSMMRRFHTRRTLRIFPLFYGYLAGLVLLLAVGIGQTSDGFWLHLLYLQNLNLVFGFEVSAFTGHLWTLAVEEQFYLLWPLVVFLLPARRLPQAMLLAVVIALVTRTTVALLDGNMSAWQQFTLARFDAFAVGAALAWWMLRSTSGAAAHRSWLNGLGLSGGAVVLVFGVYRALPGTRFSRIGGRSLGEDVAFLLVDLGGAIFFAWIIWMVVEQRFGPFGPFLRSRPVQYIGTISYGIYVLHIVAPALYRRFWHLVASGESQLDHIGGLVITLALSVASWHLFESPINQLKDRFAPSPRLEAPTPSAGTGQ